MGSLKRGEGNKMDGKVSIIIPVYNVEAYLQRCVDSLLNQQYQIIEVILIDDGSTDQSGEICDEYAKMDNRVIVFHQKNSGQSVARNKGIEMSNGEYICFVDADDYVDKSYISRLYTLLVKNQADIAMCGFDYFCEEYYSKTSYNCADEINEMSNIDMIRNMHTVKDELYVVVWGKIFRKEIVEDILFPAGRICEDVAVLYRYYERAKKTVCCKDILYFYFRNNMNSTTYTINKRFYNDVLIACEEEISFLHSKGYEELEQYAMKKIGRASCRERV